MSSLPLSLSLPPLTAVIVALAASMISTWYFLPKIILVASRRRLTDNPGRRKIHHRAIPTLGGIGIFGGFAVGFLLAINGHMPGGSYFFSALLLVFFIGMKDDLINIRPYKKVMIHTVAALIISFFLNLRITSLHGFLGIGEISLIPSVLLTTFLFIVIINSLNLVDGIDGLAAALGIVISSFFGIYAGLSGETAYAIMSAALTGTLSVFLWFNCTQGKFKIFMGDTGSMVIGFIVTVMMIRFNELNAWGDPVMPLQSSPAVSIGILIVPLFDTLRVMIIRIIRHQSPFAADKRHIHHMLLRAGMSHRKATLSIAGANVLLACTGFLLDSLGILWLTLTLLFLAISLTIPVYIAVAHAEGWNWRARKWWEIVFNIKDLEDVPEEALTGVAVDAAAARVVVGAAKEKEVKKG